MTDNNSWYFDHITEDIVYGDLNTGNAWLDMCRLLKKKAVVRKLAGNPTTRTSELPVVLGDAVKAFRRTQLGTEGGKQ
ncbi:hypothetical protein CCP1ISM_190006 [Azospirillaceae bacterium]